MARIDQSPKLLDILALREDGRGHARWGDDHAHPGKDVAVFGALPGERVLVQQSARSRQLDQARTLDVVQASEDRVTPRCAHFGVCGGCVLQHMDGDAQLRHKQQVLLDNLQQAGQLQPQQVLPPLRDGAWQYRRKGRLSVRRVEKKDKTLVGFRELDPRFVAELHACPALVPQVGERLQELAALVDGLDARAAIPQIEFNTGDDACALVFRHLQPLGEADRQRLADFGRQYGFSIHLQPGGIDSVQPLDSSAPPKLAFALPQWDVELQFQPLDFIQVNAGLNRRMIAHALQLLDVQPQDRVLELFCGLGNFSLPLARSAAEVVGVEGDAGLVERARANARRNGLDNVQFHAADLTTDLRQQPWFGGGFDKLLLDPARAGALEVLQQLPLDGIRRIVYVSCHPGSLARDAAFLVQQRGWRLASAGVMDMFPQTAHVESIAVFEPPQ